MIQLTVQGSEESTLGDHQGNEKSAKSGKRMGLLVVLAYLAAVAIALAIGPVASGPDLDLLVALIMLVAACVILRDDRALDRLEAQKRSTGPSGFRTPQAPVPNGSPFRQPRTLQAHNSAGLSHSRRKSTKKGTIHESSGFGKSKRLIDVGPAGFHPPTAKELGVTIPDSGFGLLYGRHAPQDEVIVESARQLYT